MMHKKKAFILIVFLMCLNVFHGCGSLKTQYIEKQYYDLTADLSTGISNDISGSTSNIRLKSTILIKQFSIDPAFDSHSLVYRVDKIRYIYDYYNEFVSSPAKLVSDKIAETLYASTCFQPALAKKPEDIEYRLSGKIIKLYGDFQNINDPKAIMEIRMILEQKKNRVFQQIISKTYSDAQMISSATPEHLIKGWNRGLSTIMTDFIKDFTRL